MSTPTIYCPGGAQSQTGKAVKNRYKNITIQKCGDNIKAVDDNIKAGGKGPYAVPIWNSHEGEIEPAQFVWNYVQENGIKITDLWPQRIEFWFIKRLGQSTKYGKIGSVKVANTQCSAFLAKNKAKLVPCSLTTVAHEDFRKGALWDGVLVAPGEGENEVGFEVKEKSTANPNNFTSFVRFGATKRPVKDSAIQSWLTGVSMPAFTTTLSDTVQSFFQHLVTDVSSLENLPKLIFVLKRTANVGLLFEGLRLRAGDLLDVEEEEQGIVSVYEEAGFMASFYSDELKALFNKEFSELRNNDFILHKGVNTYLFACPPLGIYTHGYEVDTVEPVVRFYIHKIFQLLGNNVKCTSTQADFFKRHEKAWRKHGSGAFIKFKIINSV